MKICLTNIVLYIFIKEIISFFKIKQNKHEILSHFETNFILYFAFDSQANFVFLKNDFENILKTTVN